MTTPNFAALHHVQLAMPPGAEDAATEFYVGVLGMRPIPKPPALADRGGVWFRSGGVELHLGVEAGFRAANKAHPGILVDDLGGLGGLLSDRGYAVRHDDDFPGFRRFYVADPFGNRLEFLQPR